MRVASNETDHFVRGADVDVDIVDCEFEYESDGVESVSSGEEARLNHGSSISLEYIDKSKLSYSATLANSLKSAVGVGILSAPYGMKEAGMWSAAVITICVAVTTAYCITLLFRCRNRTLELWCSVAAANSGTDTGPSIVEIEACLNRDSRRNSCSSTTSYQVNVNAQSDSGSDSEYDAQSQSQSMRTQSIPDAAEACECDSSVSGSGIRMPLASDAMTGQIVIPSTHDTTATAATAAATGDENTALLPRHDSKTPDADSTDPPTRLIHRNVPSPWMAPPGVGDVVLKNPASFDVSSIESDSESATIAIHNRTSTPMLRYADIARITLGKRGQIAADFCMFMSMYGGCIAYMIFIGQNMSNGDLFDPTLNFWQWICVITPICIIMSWLPNLKFLAPVSGLGFLFIVAACIVVFVYGGEHIGHGQSSRETHKNMVFNLAGLPLFFGIVAFSSEGLLALALPLEQSMRKPQKYMSVMYSTLISITTLYIAFGVIGYLLYGDDTADTLTKNLPPSTINKIVIVCLCLQLLLTYPQVMYVALKVMESYYMGAGSHNVHAESVTFKQCVYRSLVVLSSAILSLSIPHFGLFLSFMGAFANGAILFIFPTLMYLNLYRTELAHDRLQRAIVRFICFLGVCASAIGSISSLKDMITA
jgi:solute carrier family 36 (proton-coupled amino acid transporter)